MLSADRLEPATSLVTPSAHNAQCHCANKLEKPTNVDFFKVKMTDLSIKLQIISCVLPRVPLKLATSCSLLKK